MDISRTNGWTTKNPFVYAKTMDRWGVCVCNTHHLSIVAMRPIWLFLKSGVVYG
jgi:hypothetical protein